LNLRELERLEVAAFDLLVVGQRELELPNQASPSTSSISAAKLSAHQRQRGDSL
jgi:hypothetical protein